MDLLPPRWVDMQDEVTELLGDIALKAAQLDKLHQKHLLPGFGDEDARIKEEGAIERLTQDITRGFYDCQKAIQRIEMMVRESRQQGGGASSGEEMMARNIQISLAGRVQEASAQFRKKQSTYLKSMDHHRHQPLSCLQHVAIARKDRILIHSLLFIEQNYENWTVWHRRSSAPRLRCRCRCRIPTRTHP